MKNGAEMKNENEIKNEDEGVVACWSSLYIVTTIFLSIVVLKFR